MKLQKSLSAHLKGMERIHVKYDKDQVEADIQELRLRMLKIQQGVFHSNDRVVIIFEGFDAAGKGGAIRSVTEALDPRNVKVVPIGPPNAEEQGRHWLYRFWMDLPKPGHITVFDRSWYGRVLVEKVEKLTSPERLKMAHEEINQFEAMLANDGISVVKIFLAITKKEQLLRFKARLKDPYKQWKITEADIKARNNWDRYVLAVDELLKKNHTALCPWHVIEADSKRLARRQVLETITTRLKHCEQWIEKAASKTQQSRLEKMLQKL